MSNAASRDAPPGSYVANYAVGTLVLAGAACVHERRLFHGRLEDPLTSAWPLLPLDRPDRNRFPGFGRLIQRLDDTHVLQPFFSGWFGFAPLQDAIGEV